MTYIFVHSAWLGGWGYEIVADAIRSKGYFVIAPDLRGHGTDKTPAKEISFEDYVDDLTRVIDAQRGPIVLVAHSFGGIVASQVAEVRSERIVGIVYMAAFMLPSGQSFASATEGATGSVALDHLVYSDDQSSVSIDPEFAHEAVAHDVPLPNFELAAAMMVAEPTSPLGHELCLSVGHWGAIPRYYIRTTEDRAVPVTLQDAMIESIGVQAVESLASSHVPNFSHPQELATCILKLTQ